MLLGAEGASGSQRALTYIVEGARFELLDADIRALGDSDDAKMRKLSWVSVDKNSGIWVSSVPTRHLRAGPAEFKEIVAAYLGLPSPVASSLEGQGIWSRSGTRRGTCDRWGLKLCSLPLDGRFTKAHDRVKFAIARSLKDLGVSHLTEVHGLFTPLIPPGAQSRAALFMRRSVSGNGKQGLVPDFKVDLESLTDGAAATSKLAELKMLHCGRTGSARIGGTTYWTNGGSRCVFGGRNVAVNARAARLQFERENDARRIDMTFCGTPRGTVGPVLQRLRSFGAILGLVVGHFGEWNDGLELLLRAAANDAAPRMRALFDADSPRQSLGRCAFHFRREVAWAGLNANAALKLERAEFVGWDAASAAAQRDAARERDDAQRARCADTAAARDRASFAQAGREGARAG